MHSSLLNLIVLPKLAHGSIMPSPGMQVDNNISTLESFPAPWIVVDFLGDSKVDNLPRDVPDALSSDRVSQLQIRDLRIVSKLHNSNM